MKGYQLRIILKKARPPIWRRFQVPAGLTFAQLSVILNEVMGWRRGGFYLFEFFHRELQLWEAGSGKRFHPEGNYDLLEASQTFVDEFLDQEQWFSYNLKEKISHRVNIERIVKDVLPWPVVFKCKGVCTGRLDAGYDMGKVNICLRENYSVSYGEAGFPKQRELYSAQRQGKRGLLVSEHPENDPGKLRRSAFHLLKEFTALRREAMAAAKPGEAVPFVTGIKLKEVLLACGTDDLLMYARRMGLKHPSCLDKEYLAEKMADRLLVPAVMRRQMSLLTDDQIRLFEDLICKGYLSQIEEDRRADLDALHQLNYIAVYEDGMVEIPADVVWAYGRICSPAFQHRRRQTVWMRKCLAVLLFLYGEAPADVLWQFFCQDEELAAAPGELAEIFRRIPDEENPCRLLDGRVVWRRWSEDPLYMADEKNLCRLLDRRAVWRSRSESPLFVADEEEYRIPPKEEIEELYLEITCFGSLGLWDILSDIRFGRQTEGGL